jgi:hypothetical protein
MHTIVGKQPTMGTSIKDVGNLEGWEKSNFIEICQRTEVKKTAHIGEGGVKKLEKCADVFYGRPLYEIN